MLKIRVIFVFIFISFFACVFSDSSTEVISRKTQVDLIIQDLEDQTWAEDEHQCVQDTLNILNNVKNHTLWAVWIWNSMQQPTGTFYGSKYTLGNYDQCLKAPSIFGKPNILTQYCLADVKLTDYIGNRKEEPDAFGPADEYFKSKSPVGRQFNILSLGTCLPASCNPNAVTKIVKSLYLVNPIASVDPVITLDNCQVTGQEIVYSTQFYVFISVMAFLLIAAISSTIYHQDNPKNSIMTRVAYSFSLKRNWSAFTRITADDIPILHFTKVVNITMTTCSHGFVFLLMGAVGNALDFDYYMTEKKNMLGNWVQHLDLPALENFFLISGFLVMKNLMEKDRNPVITLIQRYIRFIGSFSILVFYTKMVSTYTGDGPVWNKLMGNEQKACEESWLWSILMVNNFVNNDTPCQVVAWYVQCDFQLAVMGTILFCIWQRNKSAGKVATILASILALILPGIETYRNQYPGILMYDVQHIADTRDNVVYIELYRKSHLRAGPYLIGMAMGYILTIYRPAKYRGIISTGWCYIGYILAGILGLRVWMTAAAWCLGDYNAWNSAVYATFNRNIWAVATCLCIVFTEYGDIPKIRSFIAWPGFVILSKLGYGIYITHSLILQRNIFSQRSPLQYDIFSLTVNGLGVLAASSLLAVLLWLFVEAPLSNLTNLILAPRKLTTVNDIKTENKINGHTEIIGNFEINGRTLINELKNRKHS